MSPQIEEIIRNGTNVPMYEEEWYCLKCKKVTNQEHYSISLTENKWVMTIIQKCKVCHDIVTGFEKNVG